MRRMAGRFADEGRCRPCRGTSHGRQSGCFRRTDRRSQSQDRIGVRPLRRDAGRSGGRMAHLAVRTGREGRTHLVPGCGRRQRPAFHARQGVRSDVRDRQPALQCEIPARRRGRDRVAQPLQVLRRQQEDAQGRHHSGFRYIDDLDADTFDHLRSARSDLYGGRSDRPQQGPALRPVRRCGGQSGQCPGPHGGFAHR